MIHVLRDSVYHFLSAESTSRPAVQPALEMLEQFLEIDPSAGLDETPKTQNLCGIITDLKYGGTYRQYPLLSPQ